MATRYGSIVGRDAEIAELRALVGGTSGGARGLILEGEPGIGKTVLWEDALAAATDRGQMVLTTQPASFGVAPSFASLTDLFLDVPADVFERLPEPQARALRVVTLRQDSDGTVVDSRAVSAGVRGVLRLLARSRQLVIAIDDLQWMDLPSAHALGSALRRLTAEPVCVLATLRLAEETADPVEFLRVLPRGRLTSLALGPLPLDAIDRILRERFGRSLLRPTLRRVYAGTGGNPLFALEMTRDLLSGRLRSLPGEPLPIPRNLEEAFSDRLLELDRPVRQVLLLAASLRRPTVDAIRAVAGAEIDIASTLDDAIDAGVIELLGPAVQFRHPLFASAAYGVASREERRAAHRLLAGVVSDQEERARHLALSVVGTDEKIASVLESGADHAKARGAPGAAVELAELAVQLTPTGSKERLARRQLGLARFAFAAGDNAGATRVLESIAGSTHGRWRGEALLELGIISFFASAQRGLALLNAARREPSMSVAGRAIAHTWSAWAHHYMGDIERAKRHARAAVTFANGCGDQVLLVMAMVALGLSRATAGEGVETDEMARALELEGSMDLDRELVSDRADWTYACLLSWAGDHLRATRIMKRLLKLAQDHGDEHSTADAHWNLAEMELRRGRWDQAEFHIRAREDITAQVGSGGRALATKALLLAARGDLVQARSVAMDAISGGEEAGERHQVIEGLAAIGFLEVSRGEPACGAPSLERAWDLLITCRVGEPGLFPFIPDATEALIAVGRPEAAEPMVAWLAERGKSLNRVAALAAAARCRGLLAAARGDQDDAKTELEAALALHEGDGMPFERARSLLVFGGILRRSKRKAPARRALEEAVRIFEALGAALWVAKARAELDRLAARSDTRDLTPSESRVARLASAGRTNREIAQTLFLSVRTVEGHLSKIYSKLGMRSRTELAIFLAEVDVGPR